MNDKAAFLPPGSVKARAERPREMREMREMHLGTRLSDKHGLPGFQNHKRQIVLITVLIPGFMRTREQL